MRAYSAERCESGDGGSNAHQLVRLRDFKTQEEYRQFIQGKVCLLPRMRMRIG